MFDPCARSMLGQRRPGQPPHAPPTTGPRFHLRALRICADLSDLMQAGWEPVMFRLADLETAMSGAEGVKPSRWKRPHAWAWRWSQVNVEVRAFLCEFVAEDPTVSKAVFNLIDDGPDEHGATIGHLRRLWEDSRGRPPSRYLLPRPWRNR